MVLLAAAWKAEDLRHSAEGRRSMTEGVACVNQVTVDFWLGADVCGLRIILLP